MRDRICRVMRFLFSPLISFGQLQQQDKMPKEITYITMQEQYPFPSNPPQSMSTDGTQVKKVIEYDQQTRSILKEKIRMLKSLGFQNLIGLQSSKSEEQSAILFFQYVPFQFLREVDALPQEKMVKIYEGMLELCANLAAKGMVHELDVKRVGLDKRYNLKYYLGIDFKIEKTADKEKLLDSYKALVTGFFKTMTKVHLQPQAEKEVKDKEDAVAAEFQCLQLDQAEFEINVKNVLNIEENTPKKVLKKSSILASNENDEDLKPRKVSNRFTFNHNNQISIPLYDKADLVDDSKSSKTKSGKNIDLFSRISALKSFMKDISIKVGFKNKEDSVKTTDQSNASQKLEEKKTQKANNFLKIEKKVTELRQSRLRKASNGQGTPTEKNKAQSQMTIQVTYCNNPQQSQRSSKTQKKIQSPQENKANLFSTVNYSQKPSQISFSKKNSLDICDNDRQHQQYVMLANKDKYCEEFMYFLQDEQTSQSQGNQGSKKCPEKNAAIPTPKRDDDVCKQFHKRQNLKTQSSENTLQIQSRVQKVIKSSLRLISGLRSRQSVRCE